MTTLPLARLTERETRDMIGTLAGEVLPVATLDALIARADGVPLYVEELTRSLVEPGTARSVEAIPATLADSLMGRLDRLSATKEVAQRAAVLGREFAYPLLAAVAGLEEATLRYGLARLVEAEIVYARGEPPTATYTFKHALGAGGGLRVAAQTHPSAAPRRISQVLEERFPERAASEPEVIARHYDQAGLAMPAIAHYQRAGERASSPLGERGGDRSSAARPRAARDAAGDARSGSARARAPDGHRDAARRGQGIFASGVRGIPRTRARAGFPDRRVARAASSARGGGDGLLREG